MDHTRQPVEFDGNTLVPYQGVLHRIVGESIMGKVILDSYVDGADKGTGDLKTCWPEEISFSRVARHILEFPA